MAAEDVINTAYLSTLGRPADPGGLKHYSAQLEAGRSVGEILAELNLAVESGIENVEANRLAFGTENLTAQIQANRNAAANAVAAPIQQINQGPIYSPPSQSEADIRRQVEADVAKFVAARDAGQPTAGIGTPLDTSQFTAPITSEIARDLMGRSLTGGVSNLEFDRYGGYDAVKAVYDASGGSYAPPGPSVDATNTSLATPSTQLERNPFFPTLQVREDVNYDQLFGAKPLDQGGTAPTPEAINRAFETFYNRPADTAGIQGYLQSGKSMEQINADLAYQALYAPELGLAQNAQYYEAPSQAQLGYIQSLGGGTPTFEREDTFSYTTPDPLTAEEVTSIYRDQFGYDPTPQDLEYWTQVYAMSPDVRYSPNPRQQTINAILAGSNLPQYEYLKKDTDLTGTQGVNYKGTPINPAQLANQQDSDYRGAAPTQPTNPFGGFFGDENFNPFDYTGIAPTPGMYRGYDPFADQRAAEINMLGNQYLGGNLEPQGMEFYSTQRSTGRSLADIAADLSASPEGQAFAQTGAPSTERAAISSNPFFAFRTPTEVAAEINMLGNQYLGGNFEPQGMEFYSNQRSTGRSLADIAADLSASPEGQAFAQTGAPSTERAAISSNPFNQGIVAALPGSTASTT
jgi:hypothetical protein